jgi:O-antigen/teichoic acid export membrane protein
LNEHNGGTRPGESPPGRFNEMRSLLGQNAVLLPLVAASSVLALVMQVIMARMLGPSEFSVVASLLGLMFVLAILSASIQADVARSVASISAPGGSGAATGYVARALTSSVALACVLSVVIALLSAPFATFFHFGSRNAVLAMASVTVTTLCLPVLRGDLQGKQRFLGLGLNVVFEAVVRLGAGVLLVALGFGAAGAVLAYGIGGAAALAVLLPRLVRTRVAGAPTLSLVKSMVWPIFLTNLSLVLMASLDVLVAKRFLSDDAAGSYSGMALLGRAVLFATGAISWVMLPTTAEAHAAERTPLPAFGISAMLVLVVSGGAITVYAAAPTVVINAVLGSGFAQQRAVLLMLGTAGGVFGMLLLFANLYFSRGDRWVWLVPAAALCAELALFALNHGSPAAIALDLLLPASGLLAYFTATTYLRRRSLFPPGPGTTP